MRLLLNSTNFHQYFLTTPIFNSPKNLTNIVDLLQLIYIMQNKGLVVGLVIVMIVIVGGIGVFYVASSQKTQTAKFAPGSADNNQNTVTTATIAPEDIGFTLALSQSGKSAGHAVDMQITKLDGITGIDYEFSYMYSGGLNQGGFGHLDVTPGKDLLSQEIILGTCSSGVCRYDANVTKFKMTLKITKTDNKTYESSKEISL